MLSGDVPVDIVACEKNAAVAILDGVELLTKLHKDGRLARLRQGGMKRAMPGFPLLGFLARNALRLQF